jgi:hypothetical protein
MVVTTGRKSTGKKKTAISIGPRKATSKKRNTSDSIQVDAVLVMNVNLRTTGANSHLVANKLTGYYLACEQGNRKCVREMTKALEQIASGPLPFKRAA